MHRRPCRRIPSAGGMQTVFEDYFFHDPALPMQYTLDFFTGYRSGLYCMGSAGTAAFDYFRQWVY